MDACELAEYADTCWHTQNSKCSSVKAIAAVGAAEETPMDAPGVVAAVSAPAKGQMGGHRGGKQTQACGAVSKQKLAHNYISFNYCKYGDKSGSVLT